MIMMTTEPDPMMSTEAADRRRRIAGEWRVSDHCAPKRILDLTPERSFFYSAKSSGNPT
jgi:hypothetical protein